MTPALRIWLLSLTIALGGFLFGFDSGVINGAVDALQEAFHSDSIGTGFNIASMLLGCAAGAFSAGTLADRFGRKPVLLMTALGFIVSAWGAGISSGSMEFIFYRIMGGLAVGAASVICPAYISEIAPARIRGRLASLQQLMIVIGLFCSFLSNYLLARAAGSPRMEFLWGFHAWQWMFWVGMIPATLFLLALLMIPESPRYLVGAGREAAAEAVLRGIGHAGDAREKVAEIRASMRAGHRPRWSDLWSGRGRLHPVVWVGIGLAAFQQLVGINVVFYYGAVLWRASGFSESHALLINVISGSTNIASTFIAMALVDRVGRKPLLVAGSLGMAATLGMLAVIFGRASVGGDGHLLLDKPQAAMALLSANLYVIFFACSWGPVLWIMLGEMFPNQFRGAALAVSGFFQWSANFAVTMTFPIFLNAIGLGGAYSIYAAFAAVSAVFVLRFVAETKGRRLEEMSAG